MSDVTLEVLSDQAEPAGLAEFIDGAPNGTLFHRPRFLSYHGESKFQRDGNVPANVLFRKGGKIVAFIPGMYRKESDGKWSYVSPTGSSCGGFVSGLIEFEDAQACLSLFLEAVLAKASRITITPPADCYERRPAGNLWRFLLTSAGFAPAGGVLSHAKDLTDPRPFEEAFTHSGRKNLNKARRSGITCGVANHRLDDFYAMLLATKTRLGASPTHTLEELRTIESLFPDRHHLFLAEKDGVPAAGAYCFHANPHCLTIFYYCDEPPVREFRPTNILLYEVLGWAVERGYRFVDFGPSTFGYEPNTGVIAFKESFAASPYIRVAYNRP